jgi:ubiquinone/menaquinone biosynthesis C-methylase UbiE
MADRELIEHFSTRSEHYDEKGIWVKDESVLRATLDFMALRPRLKVLDAGAGTGVVLEAALKVCGDLDLCVAIDASHTMLQRIRASNIRRCVSDISSIPLRDGLFDVALCRQVLHYIADIEGVIAQVHRVLAANGALVVGQIVPFGDADEEQWTRILRARQPLRKRFLNQHQLRSALLQSGFLLQRVSELRVRESLNSWLQRYETSQEQAAETRRLFLDSPASSKAVRNVTIVKEDIAFENCWLFIRGVKNAH